MTTIERFIKLYWGATEEERQRYDDLILGASISKKAKDGHVYNNPTSDTDVPSVREVDETEEQIRKICEVTKK